MALRFFTLEPLWGRKCNLPFSEFKTISFFGSLVRFYIWFLLRLGRERSYCATLALGKNNLREGKFAFILTLFMNLSSSFGVMVVEVKNWFVFLSQVPNSFTHLFHNLFPKIKFIDVLTLIISLKGWPMICEYA